ncbi:glycosyltransferase [Cetobacterium sp. ZOR0034]|uniref:glycosyltransferase n=1 Tax=Cetobacterium sp. ZOR0034 TaxID=1339239 RepID=UPI000647ADDB|nr:glycosyltransferase [Cetobacterium sp. ZOR0034]
MKKKIAIYNGQLYMGGIERVLINYLEKLAKEPELDITLIIKENIPEKNIFLNEVPDNIKVVFIKSEEMCRNTDRLRGYKKSFISRIQYQWALFYERIVMKNWVKEHFKNNKYHTVVDFDMSLSKYVQEVKQDVVAWVHFTLKGRKKKRVKLFREKCEYYKKIVVICDDMKDELIELMPEYTEKVVRIYNPMDFDTIRKKSKDLSELSEDDRKLLDDRYFVGISRLVAGKNRVGLVEIYSELKKRGIKQKLYIIGDGEDRVNVEKRVEELNLQEDVLLLGQKKNPLPFMKNAELFLHTSMGEGLPTVFIEAMLCDTIVLAYDCPTGPREILADGKAGGLIRLNDKKAFEDKVIEILNNEELQQSIRKEMDLKIAEFSYEDIRETLLNLFD